LAHDLRHASFSSVRGRSDPPVRFGEQRDWVHDSQPQTFATRAIEKLEQTSRITRGHHWSAGRSDVLHFPFEKLISHFRLD